jgi:molybdopterin-containing oxidoreductase family iron-sulfur binding subunit
MVIDVKKCLKEEVRVACSEACHQAHNVPKIDNPKNEIKWIWKEPFAEALPDQRHDYMASELEHGKVLVLCNHCDNPPCTRVCPTQATWKRESDGVVMMDMHRCIGCRYCMAACPYGSRSFNYSDPRKEEIEKEDGKFVTDYPTRTKGVVEKCTFCTEKIRAWQVRTEKDPELLKTEPAPVPACVEALASDPETADVLLFGNVNDLDSKVSQVVRSRHTICRRAGLGTGPNVYYVVEGLEIQG